MSLYLGNIKISGVNVIFNDGAGSDVNETNIKTGITILGVTGTYTENGTQTAGQEIATADKIVNGYSVISIDKSAFNKIDSSAEKGDCLIPQNGQTVFKNDANFREAFENINKEIAEIRSKDAE